MVSLSVAYSGPEMIITCVPYCIYIKYSCVTSELLVTVITFDRWTVKGNQEATIGCYSYLVFIASAYLRNRKMS